VNKIKKYLSFAVLLSLVFLLTGCNLFQKKEEISEKGLSSSSKENKEEESYSGTLEKMMSLGIPLKCSWKKDDSYYGVSWLKGKKSYGEVHMQGQTNKVVFKDDCMWSWQEGNNQGLKMCFQPDEIEKMSEAGKQDSMGSQKMGPPADINYNCHPAVFTDSKFNLPKSVVFTSMEEMMEGRMESNP